jgi:allophanate hydrolase subunit 1
MQKFKINFFRYSLDSILVNWPAKISIEISTQINSFSNAILKNPNILELRKGYCSLLIIQNRN